MNRRINSETLRSGGKNLPVWMLLSVMFFSFSRIAISGSLPVPGNELAAKVFYSAIVDDNNTKWFITDAGIVSFDGKTWTVHNNPKLPAGSLKNLVFNTSAKGRELWISTPNGVMVASLPLDATKEPVAIMNGASPQGSNNVLSVAIGKEPLRWIGTDKGISAYYGDKWLKNSYDQKYPESMFKEFPITAMVATADGDSLYVATEGAGVARLYRDKVDGISGASEYAAWGPIDMPSDKIYSLCITPDGTQWLGTDQGVARHEGYLTLEKWTVFKTESGLINNFVKAIAVDKSGKVWFGTKGGVSVFDGKTWVSYTDKDGLSSININCITVDKDGTVWIGTDNGINSFSNGKIQAIK